MKATFLMLVSCLLLSACSTIPLTTDGLPASQTRGIKDTREVVTLPSGLKYIDLKVGGMAITAVPNKLAIVAYTGELEDGTQFDSTFKRREPFQFRIGHKQVVAGWDQGIIGMNVGGIRRLIIPPELGYGVTGVPGVIPPNATLIFDITLLELKK